MKILSIDDDRDFNIALERMLSSKRIEIHTAENQQQFFDMFELVSPDLCLVDLNLNFQGEGKEVISKIKHESEYLVPIIALSRVDDDRVIDQLFQLGIDDFVSKPLDEYILKNKIAMATGLSIGQDSVHSSDVPRELQSIEIDVYMQLMEINRHGLILESDSFISTGSKIQITHKLFSDLGLENLEMEVGKVSKNGLKFEMFLPYLPNLNLFKLMRAKTLSHDLILNF
ncbi:response regulator [Bacteriovoracaceae bacterium]|nr:response regulator [Bacteriovoracaceae bacterium]